MRSRFDKDCTFHPDTGNAERVLANSKRVVRLGETPKERIARLAFLEKQQKEAKQALAEENYHKQFTFKPKLSATAKTKKPTPLNDLVTNPKGVQVRAVAEAAAREAFVSECTFEPNVGAKHADARRRPFQVDYSKQGGITARIREYRREKEICLQEARNEKEFKELEECTFSPTRGEEIKPKPTKGVTEVVPGLGRHLELRRRAKQMEEEARARAAKVFLEDAAKKDVTHRRDGAAKPQHQRQRRDGAKAEERRRRLLAEKEAREKADCTFRPKTNERPRKELIERLLAEEEDDMEEYGSPLSAAYTAA